ncbi:uncharacterized protein BDW47DRAFT_82264 [Aspergillus candidus]|uniref:Uncharacterized protein n=1 Tax=Aspergillus candidus TaxID=41067 RepID=A0A2I2FJH7_ASPCN|nr:hypothetical protein BDW47DRAFT_82264 [Aspergillus candidus]PLB40781.1 hypothetical protein BDW47DRAFT_82264 [Aspergillus candidus]
MGVLGGVPGGQVLLPVGQPLCALDKAGVDGGLVAGGDEHHLSIGDLDDVAAGEDGVGAALEDAVVDADAVATVDADMPRGCVLAVVKDLGVEARHELARTQVDIDLGERARGDGDGTGLLVELLLAVGFAADVDMEGLDVIGPVAAGDFGVGTDALLVFGLGVGVVAQHADLFAGDIEV